MTYYEFQTIQIQNIAVGDACAWWFSDFLGIGASEFGKKQSMQALRDAGRIEDRKPKSAGTEQSNTDD